MNSALTVSQLNFYIKSIFESETHLQHVCVQGEISNYVEHFKSGHLYFSLKDSTSAIKCVMFRSSAVRLKFRPQDGMRVLVAGRVSVFERDGQYQLYAESIIPDGAGALAQAYAQLKEKLAKEGLFDSARKKPIPVFPGRIGVVTAKDGAAVRDIVNILARRWPIAEIILCPVTVQGNTAAASIAQALARLNTLVCCDVIIVGRGGGSMEDLWAFNEEILVRAVAACEIPVISAVGHETDFTLCDFAADLRAPTPSAAAELAVPDRGEMQIQLQHLKARLQNGTEALFSARQAEVLRMRERTRRERLLSLLDGYMQYCDGLSVSMRLVAEKKTEQATARLSEQIRALDALSPLKVLTRGYAICEKDNHVISGVHSLTPGDRTELIFADGRATCDIAAIKTE